MSLKFDGDYYAKATDAGPRVPLSFPSARFQQNYDEIRWDKEDDMNLAKADPKQMAARVFTGALQLDEIPISRRATVAGHVEQLKAAAREAAEKVAAAEKTAKKKGAVKNAKKTK